VFPEHKFHIVDVLQKRGHMVGMTGDGSTTPRRSRRPIAASLSRTPPTPHGGSGHRADDPGLSVIIDAIKESRRIVQRMNSYAIYRIAETLRVLLFVTLTILIFNFFP